MPIVSKMRTDLAEQLPMPEGVSGLFDNGVLTIKGPKGEVKRTLIDPSMQVSVKDNSVLINSKGATRREKAKVFSVKAHVKNMFIGVTEAHVYKLKICAGHFPMNVAFQNKVLIVKNFLGEKYPRTLEVLDSVDVKVDGTDITVSSVDVEVAGRTAASIEQLTRITNRDLRIFQDGIYIVDKRGKQI